MVVAAAAAFVGTHFLLSHPLRRPLVGAVGERRFLGIYSLVALATFAWLVLAYAAAPESLPLWPVGDGLWALATVVMLVASILLVGSFFGNPAFPDPGAEAAPAAPEPRGVFAITRHPMMWSFALWAACHIAVYPVPANLILSAGILLLALVGAAMQDRKKRALQPKSWADWERRTSFVPFAALLAGRTGGSARPGAGVTAGGVLLWIVATWAHMPLWGWPAGFWRWIV